MNSLSNLNRMLDAIIPLRDRNTIKFDKPVFTVEELRTYVTDGMFTPRLVLADGTTMSVQMFKGAYCTPRGWSYGEPQDRNHPMTAVEVGPMSPIPSELVPFAEAAEDVNTIFPYTPVNVVETIFKKAGGVVSVCSRTPIRVAPWMVYASEQLIELRKHVDDLTGVSGNSFVVDQMVTKNCHITVKDYNKDDSSLVVVFNGVDAEYVEEAKVSVILDRAAINRLEQKISGVGGIILEHFLKKTGIASLSESKRGVAFVPAHFPDLTIEISLLERDRLDV